MTTEAEAAREHAMQIEAKKDGLHELKNGEWTLKLRLISSEIPIPLVRAAMGTRYILALVEIADNEEPVQTVGKSYARRAAVCCKEPAFWEFCRETFHFERITHEEAAIEFVREYCGVASRSELIENTRPGAKWKMLYLDYQNWLMS